MANEGMALLGGLAMRHPIVAAPMAGVTTPELAAAVSEAGGLGVLALAGADPDEMCAQMARARTLTSRPIGVNLFANRAPERDTEREARAAAALAPLYRELSVGQPAELAAVGPGVDRERLAVVLELSPALVSFHFGLPSPELLEPLARAGVPIATTATTVAEAIAAERAGADLVIAQGGEAGGHRGTLDPECEPIGTLALVPQVVDAVACPVIAAGGIGDGRGVAAALALGATAAQIGTAFVVASESAADEAHRAAVIATPGEGTVMTRAFTGRPARGRRNRLSQTLAAGRAIAPFPLQRHLTGPLAVGGAEYRALWMGQAASLARAEPAARITERLGLEARRVLAEGARALPLDREALD